jgi:hypothetical protein
MESDCYASFAYSQSSTIGQQSVNTTAGQTCAHNSEPFTHGWTELG